MNSMDLTYIINCISSLSFTNFGWQIATPLIFSLADIISGTVQAIINHNLDSQKMRAGLWHKTLILLIIILGFVVHFAFNWSWFSQTVCIYIIIMELISILENLKKAGFDIGNLSKYLKEKTDSNTQESIGKLVDIVENNIKESEE